MNRSIKGRNKPLIKTLAALKQNAEKTSRYAGLPNACVRATIKDVDDPLERGRVRVVFDDFDPRCPQVANAGDASGDRIAEGEPQLSHWIDVSPAFKGKQPKGMVDKHCNITISNGQYQYAILGDVLYDPELFTEEAGKALRQPNNSCMTRMPIYPAGELPPPCEENHGCSVIEKGGPYGNDWLCICLQRSGKYLWVRHVDMQHGHAGANDTTAYADTGGDKAPPGKAGTVNDLVFVTTANPMICYSAYGNAPRGNPEGDACQWFPPPMDTELKPLPIYPPALVNQDQAIEVLREGTGFPNNIPGQLGKATGGIIPPLNSLLPFPGFSLNFKTLYNNVTQAALDYAKNQLSQLTGGVSDTILNLTNNNP